jgi:hypothetical protein
VADLTFNGRIIIITFSIRPLKSHIPAVAGALFLLNAHCGTMFSCSDETSTFNGMMSSSPVKSQNSPFKIPSKKSQQAATAWRDLIPALKG